MKKILIGAAAATLGLALGAPAPSRACLHVIELSKDDAVAAVARAERLLNVGRPADAYRAARTGRRRLERHVREVGRDASAQAAIARARTITAVAVVRLDGRTPVSYRVARRHVVRGREQRSLSWAREQLRALAAERPGDLRAQVRYAEALARFDAHRDEARAILAPLAERDLMPDAHGYAALARISETGSPEHARAVERCRRMAADAAPMVCPPSVSSSVSPAA